MTEKEPKIPRKRLEMALKLIKEPLSRLIIRRIWESEFRYASIFWDEDKEEVEFITDNLSIVFTENK